MIQNIAWKLFYPTSFHKQDAERLSIVKGVNVSVVGYPMADEFLNRKTTFIWKCSSYNIKRLIWAPHYTVDNYGVLNYSTFSRYHEIMFEIAEKPDRIRERIRNLEEEITILEKAKSAFSAKGTRE